MSTRTAVVLFTRDLRVHDHPALATACAAFDRVVPLYVLDPALADRSPNRTRFLHQSLAELREALRRRGGDLVVRRGDPVAETIRLAREVGAEGVGLSADVSRYARRWERGLRAECDRPCSVPTRVAHLRRPPKACTDRESAAAVRAPARTLCSAAFPATATLGNGW
ncbi:deoxyribodipyrimidine photo-lyase [Micromonospora sp. IBSANI012]|uniref:deoxyribodipyrimidine photo-lyase n=1 Tax=Micromonospora sp. IBSANI012 TaxID=3457761 RepID=UPI00405A1984